MLDMLWGKRPGNRLVSVIVLLSTFALVMIGCSGDHISLPEGVGYAIAFEELNKNKNVVLNGINESEAFAKRLTGVEAIHFDSSGDDGVAGGPAYFSTRKYRSADESRYRRVGFVAERIILSTVSCFKDDRLLFSGIVLSKINPNGSVAHVTISDEGARGSADSIR